MKHSIGLNWLRRINRHLPTPTLIVTDHCESGAGGFYCQPWHRDVTHNGIHVPASSRGTIVCVHFDHLEWDLPAVIAHEWRHHYQHNRAIKPILSPLRDGDEDYELHIAHYFSRSLTEYDALRFECRHAPERENLWRKANVDHFMRTGKTIEWAG